MEKIFQPKSAIWTQLLTRPVYDGKALQETVDKVFSDVRKEGDRAILRYTSEYDGIAMDRIDISDEEFTEADTMVPSELKTAIGQARSNIEKFHRAQQTPAVHVSTMEGVECWQEKKAIQKVGLYIPGGTAPLFSTVLMLAIPAVIAGCDEIVLCTPPGAHGKIHPAILYAARLCGIGKIFKAGGIQAIAGMALGTESIPAVYKIFGPGNQYVTLAKQTASRYGTAIDMPAGPSELLVLADDSADASFVAADLLSQAEHGPDSQVILVTTSREFLNKVAMAVEEQMPSLPRRSLAAKAMENSKLIFLEDEKQAIDLVNEYAPEHLIISCVNESFYLQHIINAGSVFLGRFSPESAGDYASGTNHTLPTNGYARQYGGVNLDSYMKSITFQRITEKGLGNIGPTIEIMAAAEGLWAHGQAVSLRLQSIKTNAGK